MVEIPIWVRGQLSSVSELGIWPTWQEMAVSGRSLTLASINTQEVSSLVRYFEPTITKPKKRADAAIITVVAAHPNICCRFDTVSDPIARGLNGIILIGWSTAFFVTLIARMRRN